MERAELARLLGGKVSVSGPRRILVAESEPRQFMSAFTRALAGGTEVFLGSAEWGAMERSQVDVLLAGRGPEPSPEGYLMIPTGGTGGQLRFARHDAATIRAAVHGFTRHFALPQVNALGVLPLHHVSGLMAWMRCALTGGEYRPVDWKAIAGGALPALPEKKVHGWTISLVPTQLERLLQQPAAAAWLRGFRMVLLGGAPAGPGLLDKAAALQLPLAPGYGLTETAAMVAALRPAEFLAGARSSGTVMPHAQLTLDDEGLIGVRGASVFRGYYPAWREQGDFPTRDGGWWDGQGQLHIAGRRDAVIITGGEKVDPAEIEAVLRGSGELPAVVVVGVPDAEWGQVVVAAYPAETSPDLARVAVAIARLLSPAKRPKRFVGLPAWPVNAQGKVNRAEVFQQVLARGPAGDQCGR